MNDEIEQYKLITEINEMNEFNIPNIYNPKPELAKSKSTSKTTQKQLRDKKRSLNALNRAGYLCEWDRNHTSFIRKSNGKTYTEPHHLIPLAFQGYFTNSLDVEANIVSLCSNCHNLAHYGKDSEELIKDLYELRKRELELAGICISEDELLCYYRF